MQRIFAKIVPYRIYILLRRRAFGFRLCCILRGWGWDGTFFNRRPSGGFRGYGFCRRPIRGHPIAFRLAGRIIARLPVAFRFRRQWMQRIFAEIITYSLHIPLRRRAVGFRLYRILLRRG